jgi:hypothetical protein
VPLCDIFCRVGRHDETGAACSALSLVLFHDLLATLRCLGTAASAKSGKERHVYGIEAARAGFVMAGFSATTPSLTAQNGRTQARARVLATPCLAARLCTCRGVSHCASLFTAHLHLLPLPHLLSFFSDELYFPFSGVLRLALRGSLVLTASRGGCVA